MIAERAAIGVGSILMKSAASARQPYLERSYVSLGGDQSHFWEVSSIAGDVAGEQRQLLDLRMGADVEVGERRSFLPAFFTVVSKCLSTEVSCCVG